MGVNTAFSFADGLPERYTPLKLSADSVGGCDMKDRISQLRDLVRGGVGVVSARHTATHICRLDVRDRGDHRANVVADRWGLQTFAEIVFSVGAGGTVLVIVRVAFRKATTVALTICVQ